MKAKTTRGEIWRLTKENGMEWLVNPHAATGKVCKCGICWCCKAYSVYQQAIGYDKYYNDAVENEVLL